jgi:lipopolysaccharide exporter
MTKSEHERLPVAVLLSGREKFGAYYGGALARWTYEVYRHLTSSVSVTVFGFPTADGDRYPLPHQTSQAWRLCAVMGRVPLARRYEEYVWLRALLGRLRRFAVIHIHNRPQWAAMLRRLGYTGSVIVHLQNDHVGHWSGAMLDVLASHLDAIVVCSEYLRSTFASRSAALLAKSHVVFNGANTELFYPQEHIRENKTIFFVGRFDAQKGVLPLVNSYAQVLKEHPDAKLVIGGTTGFGSHEETAYVRQVREAAGSVIREKRGDIQFAGYIHHDRDLPGWFQRATIFASPSLFQEPFGLVNVEAMACGTVVVGSNRGGIPEVLGDAGLLVDPENSHEFGGALSLLLGDVKRRSVLAAASLERARQLFDWTVIAEQWEKLLARVCRTQGVALPPAGGAAD